MLTITSQRSPEDNYWKELRIKFALLPKILEDGSVVWMKTYQELWLFHHYKNYRYDMVTDQYLIRRNRTLSNSIEDFKQMDVQELKKSLDGLE